jgi:hypothetical protein
MAHLHEQLGYENPVSEGEEDGEDVIAKFKKLGWVRQMYLVIQFLMLWEYVENVCYCSASAWLLCSCR